MERTRLFISHARPEDDAFTRWITLQLAKHGYAVWCDLTQLLGGENFYKNIETVIRQDTVKFLYVLTESSNQRLGALEELHVAKDTAKNNNLDDFIIPLHLDSLPRREMNMYLSPLNSVPFDKGWAAGLKQLLDKLERAEVPKDSNFSPEAVTLWWRQQHSASAGIVRQQSECLSNLFTIRALPDKIYFHALNKAPDTPRGDAIQMPYPAAYFGSYLVTFAPRTDLIKEIGQPPLIDDSKEFDTLRFLEGIGGRDFIESKERHDVVYQLLRLIWVKLLEKRSLALYEMANQGQCHYFKKDQVPSNEVKFVGVNGNRLRRGIVGYKTLKGRNGSQVRRYWHFGITAKPHMNSVHNLFAFCVKAHVLFSDDGSTLWDNKERMHRARRNQCAMWWNADWRDRIIATMTWLAGEEDAIQVPVKSDFSVKIDTHPLVFVSPVTHLEVDQEPESIFPEDHEESEEEEDI